MKLYADYEFYSEEFHGKMSVEQFNAAIIQASAYIRYATLGRSEGSEAEELKYAVSALCDAYAEVYYNVDESTGKGIKSENTDGYSVTYATEFADGTTKEEAFKKKAYELLKMYLAGTGLLSARVGVIR